MTVFNLGSINIDLVYRVAHFPAPGETIGSNGFSRGLGGKGANQSIAVARAGGAVRHIGMIHPDERWALDEMARYGVDTGAIAMGEVPSGHAVIYVDDAGENTIVLFAGANRAIEPAHLDAALAGAKPGDWLILQNETNLGADAARLARRKGMKVAYSAAPFDAKQALEMLPLVDLIAVNAGEAAQLAHALGCEVAQIDVPQLLVTKGAEGASYRADGITHDHPVFRVTPVDTTGAGDTFLGYFIAALDAGLGPQPALERASAAAAIQITRAGAAKAIPALAEVNALLAAD